MIRLLRIGTLFVVPILFWYGAAIFPILVTSENLRFLGSIVSICWVIDFAFLQKIGNLTNLEAIGSADLRELNFKLANIRHRVWWMAGICLTCSILIWFVTAVDSIYDVRVIAFFVGILFSIVLSYLVVLPFWFNELQAYQDSLKSKSAEKFKRDTQVKMMNETAKK